MVKKVLNIVTVVLSIFTATIHCNAQDLMMYNVTRMPFNTNYFNEISPVIGKDGGIMFCSDRRLTALVDKTSFDGRRLFNIFQIAKSDLSNIDAIIEPKNEPSKISFDVRRLLNIFHTTSDTSNNFTVTELQSERAMKFNSGPFCISADGRIIYFTSEVETDKNTLDKNFVNRNGIFIAELSGGQMLNAQPFRYNSLEYDVGQPSLSADGKTLYFVSNKPGGYGGSDIYYCELVNNEWSEPVNIGANVNSSASECYPFIHSSGRLYFSSDREGGIGKLDIYSTKKVDGKWEGPILLPEPINSKSDDFSFVFDADLQKGYFSSNRANYDDIYSFTSNIRRMVICDTLQENSHCYLFEEVNAVNEDSSSSFRYIWKFGDGTTAIGVSVVHCYEKPGVYLVQLDVENLITNEVLFNEKSETLYTYDIEQPYITSPDVAVAGAMIKLDADKTYLPGWDIGQYYWNFDDETIQVGKEVNKVYTKPGTYNVQLIVTEKALNGEVIRETCVCKNITVSAGQ